MRQRTILFISLLIFFSGLASRQLTAQHGTIHDTLQVMDYEHPKEYVIADVTISGIEYIQKEVLVSLSGLKKGTGVRGEKHVQIG